MSLLRTLRTSKRPLLSRKASKKLEEELKSLDRSEEAHKDIDKFNRR